MHLIERNQPEKTPHCVRPTAENAGKVKTVETVKTTGCHRMRDGGMKRWSTEEFEGCELVILVGLLEGSAAHMSFVQTHRLYKAE